MRLCLLHWWANWRSSSSLMELSVIKRKVASTDRREKCRTRDLIIRPCNLNRGSPVAETVAAPVFLTVGPSYRIPSGPFPSVARADYPAKWLEQSHWCPLKLYTNEFLSLSACVCLMQKPQLAPTLQQCRKCHRTNVTKVHSPPLLELRANERDNLTRRYIFKKIQQNVCCWKHPNVVDCW